MAGEDNEQEMQGSDRTAFQAKYVSGKALKGAAIGALIGAVAAAVISTAAVGGTLLAIPYIGGAAAFLTVITGIAGAGLAGAAGFGALWGALAGGGIGAIMGVSSADEAVVAEEDRREDLALRRGDRQERNMVLAERVMQQKQAMKAQADALGLTQGPGAGLPYNNKGAGGISGPA